MQSKSTIYFNGSRTGRRFSSTLVLAAVDEVWTAGSQKVLTYRTAPIDQPFRPLTRWGLYLYTQATTGDAGRNRFSQSVGQNQQADPDQVSAGVPVRYHGPEQGVVLFFLCPHTDIEQAESVPAL